MRRYQQQYSAVLLGRVGRGEELWGPQEPTIMDVMRDELASLQENNLQLCECVGRSEEGRGGGREGWRKGGLEKGRERGRRGGRRGREREGGGRIAVHTTSKYDLTSHIPSNTVHISPTQHIPTLHTHTTHPHYIPTLHTPTLHTPHTATEVADLNITSTRLASQLTPLHQKVSNLSARLAQLQCEVGGRKEEKERREKQKRAETQTELLKLRRELDVSGIVLTDLT